MNLAGVIRTLSELLPITPLTEVTLGVNPSSRGPREKKYAISGATPSSSAAMALIHIQAPAPSLENASDEVTT